MENFRLQEKDPQQIKAYKAARKVLLHQDMDEDIRQEEMPNVLRNLIELSTENESRLGFQRELALLLEEKKQSPKHREEALKLWNQVCESDELVPVRVLFSSRRHQSNGFFRMLPMKLLRIHSTSLTSSRNQS
jgi:hypothetical protein